MRPLANGLRPRAPVAALALWIVLALARPAAAAPFTFFFDGPGGFGVSAAQKDAAEISNVIFPVVSPADIRDITGTLSVVDQTLDLATLTPDPPVAPSGNSVASSWTVENVSGGFLGTTYLLFVSGQEFEFEGETVEYQDANVGVTADPALGWVLVQADGPEGPLFYPAIDLGALPAGAQAAPFDVVYTINEPLAQPAPNTFVLPQLVVGAAIPEPATGVLVGAGLAGLAALRRRRS